MRTSVRKTFWQLMSLSTSSICRMSAQTCLSLLLLASIVGCTKVVDEMPSIPSYGPPSPPQEQIAPCPGSVDQWTWQQGEYVWQGRMYTWREGRWVRRPAPEARWQPGLWLPRTYGWTLVPGYWY